MKRKKRFMVLLAGEQNGAYAGESTERRQAYVPTVLDDEPGGYAPPWSTSSRLEAARTARALGRVEGVGRVRVVSFVDRGEGGE